MFSCSFTQNNKKKKQKLWARMVWHLKSTKPTRRWCKNVNEKRMPPLKPINTKYKKKGTRQHLFIGFVFYFFDAMIKMHSFFDKKKKKREQSKRKKCKAIDTHKKKETKFRKGTKKIKNVIEMKQKKNAQQNKCVKQHKKKTKEEIPLSYVFVR